MVSGSTHLVSIKPASVDTAVHTIGSEKAKLEDASAAVYTIGSENAKVEDASAAVHTSALEGTMS